MSDLTVTDSGLYVVEAENENGTTDKEFEIEVVGKLVFDTWSFCYIILLVELGLHHKNIVFTSLKNNSFIEMFLKEILFSIK